MSKFIAAVMMMPALALSATAADASDLCARLQARLNQMPEIIGSGAAGQLKSESIFRLNRLEIAIRQDLRRLDCPTASVIAWDEEHAEACSNLGQELATVLSQKRSFEELQPVLSQHVDDGTGLLPAILREMRKANCREQGIEAEVEIITHRAGEAALDDAVYAEEPLYGEDAYPQEQGDTGETQDLTGLLGENGASEYGTPEPYGMIEVRPGDAGKGQSITSVELPKLEDSGVIVAPGAVTPAPAEKQAAAPSIPLRDYDPNDKRVRRVGPSFLDDNDGIDLGQASGQAAAQ
jgi:hypothetical protein